VVDGRVVGATRYLELEVFTATMGETDVPTDDVPPTVLEIGGTWYAASAQRTSVNTACKRLLLGQAFDTWGVLRVMLKTDARNARSRAAIERLGAAYEGIRRVHVRATDGGLRDSAYYSVVASEWPPIRERLTDLLR
jgi:RimJ/RimL family protein N-acetyltransferase